ncbi:MAG TPA: flagellar hook capping FlgD N-terminal domain-containing protein [Syntrophomonadaceae bacterium]|nr:flagellar hook capping FlgD N-terminal domain-containing protein [Syntrophomonadaceae bacterium]
MSVTSTSSASNTTSATTSSSTSSSSSLDKNAFLKLMCTQLQNQDPLNPMSDTEYISQMSSFSSLEQMENLNTGFTSLSKSITDVLANLTLQQAGNAVGQEITYVNPDAKGTNDQYLTGTIESVMIKDGVPYYKVGGKTISQDEVVAIGKKDQDQIGMLEDILDQLKELNDTQTQEEG